MATQLFFRAQSFNIPSNSPWRWQNGGLVDSEVNASASVHNNGGLTTGRGSAAANFDTNTAAGPTKVALQRIVGTIAQWVSAPLGDDVTISGTITLNLRASETSMNANAAMNASVYKVANDGTVTKIGASNRTTELGTSEAAQNFTITPTSTAFSKGDRIRVILWFQDGGGTLASGFQVNFVYDGPTSGASGDSFISFTETFSLVETDPTGTTLYPTNSVSATATSDNDLEAWTSRGAGVQSATVASQNGNVTPIQFATTPISWWSKPLQAVTLSGVVLANLRGMESSVSANATLRCEIAITAGDGSGATVWGATTFDSELSTTEATIVPSFYVSGPDTNISDGQRIRIRVFADDMEAGAMVTGFTITFRYAGTSGGASGDSFLTFPVTLAESVGGGGGGSSSPPSSRLMQQLLAQ